MALPSLREIERESLHSFIESCAEHFAGKRVLDFGSGRQPYRDRIEFFGGDYHPFDRTWHPASCADEDVGDDNPCARGSWDTIVCTQVLQYVPMPKILIASLRYALKPGGVLVVTVPTHWPEVEEADLWRFTGAGLHRLLEDANMRVERLERRAEFSWNRETFAIGYGAVARAAS